MGLMVRTVQPPAPAMHDVLVCQRADTFHGHQSADQHNKIEQHVTVRGMTKSGARVTSTGVFCHAAVTCCRAFRYEAIVMFSPLTLYKLRRMVHPQFRIP
ncbi:hypothetical protein D3C73_1127760 [compost metagenome]